MALRANPDPWIGALYKFILQHPVGRYTNISLEDRVIPSMNVTRLKGGSSYTVEMLLQNSNRRRLTFDSTGKITQDEILL